MRPLTDSRRHLAYGLFTLGLLALAVGAWAEITGGVRTHVLGIPLSVRGSFRAGLLAFVLILTSTTMLWKERTTAESTRRLVEWLLNMVVPLAALSVLVVGLSLGTRAAGGSDPYGYVSQAQLWLAGNLHVPQDYAAAVPWPEADWTLTPLGYRPGPGHTLVPTYAPGLPLLMALFQLALGACGPYIVGPVCGAALVLLTYGLGARLSGRPVGIMAALLTATSPTVLFMTLWTMSDVPAATFWTASLLFACYGTTGWTMASAIAAGVAIVIRPNLAPLALFPLLIAVWPLLRREPLTPVVGRAALFGLACAPFVLLVARVNQVLYGSAAQSGYGGLDTIFASTNAPANLARYPRWLLESQSPLVFMFLLSVVVGRRRSADEPPLRAIFLTFVLAVFGLYLFYMPFDAWWFLRFLLPAFPVLFVLAADTVWNGLARFGNRVRRGAAVTFTAFMMHFAIDIVRARTVLKIGEGEQKYADVGVYLGQRLPPRAVVLSMQHSGGIRYYSGRLTLRYDVLQPAWLDRALDHLAATGQPPYLLLEDWEVPVFRERFAGQRYVQALDRAPLATNETGKVLLFGVMDPPPNGSEPAIMPRASQCR